jgi:hypothetical protein
MDPANDDATTLAVADRQGVLFIIEVIPRQAPICLLHVVARAKLKAAFL